MSTQKNVVDYNHNYNLQVQDLYIRYLLQDKEAFALCRTILQDTFFDDNLRRTVRFILDYSDENHSLPSFEQINAKTSYGLTKLEEDLTHDRKWFLSEIEGFCKYRGMESAIIEGVDLLQQGRGSEVMTRIRDALSISLMSDLGTNFFGTTFERLTRLQDRSSIISTGWRSLDEKLYGGFGKGTLNVFAGNSGAGKSVLLQNYALNQAVAGRNVVYITLELSEDLIGVRMDSMISGRSTSDLMRDPAEGAMIVNKKGKDAGSLTVKKLPEGGTNANTIRAYLKELQIKTGLKTDILVVDYLDLMYPISSRIDVGDHFVKDKYVSEELRGLAGEFDVPCVTASQLNRSSIDTQDFDHSHIAGGISKINTADNVFAILATAAMKERGLFVLQFMKARSSSATGQRIDMCYDAPTMRISDNPILHDDPNQPKSTIEVKAALQSKLKAATKPAGVAVKEVLPSAPVSGFPAVDAASGSNDEAAAAADKVPSEPSPVSKFKALLLKQQEAPIPPPT